MAGYHTPSWGDIMRDSNDGPLEIIKWGNRLLYLALFVFMIVSMSYWDYPPTLPYLGAILCLFYVNRIWERYGKEEGEREVAETNQEG